MALTQSNQIQVERPTLRQKEWVENEWILDFALNLSTI